MIYVIHRYAWLQLYIISVVARLLTFYVAEVLKKSLLLYTNACPKNVFFIAGYVSVDLLYIWLEIIFMVIACTNILR